MSETKTNSMIRRHSVTLFFVLTFLIAYVMIMLVFLTGIEWPVYVAAVSASIAGLITAALTGGKEGLKRLLSGFIRWRCNPMWYILAIIIPPMIILITIGISMIFNTQFQIQWTAGWAMVITIFSLEFVQSGLGEEIGWRGYATPKLMERRSALVSSLIVGVVWAAWHIPLYFIPGWIQHTLSQSIGFPLTFMVYSSFIIALAIAHSWIYLVSKGNLWLPVLMHSSINSFMAFFALGDFEVYGLMPMIIVICVWIAFAVAVTLIFGPRRLSRSTQ